ncbi:MAG TPA: SIMPL domain-containing protein [Candidatus Limnocylindrales bacterium]
MKRRITVPGQGSVVVEPDVASIRLGVNIVARTAGAARESAAATMTKVLVALDKTGVARRDVRTSLVSLSPTLDYSDGNAPRVTGYQLQNSVSVTLRDLAKAGELIDAALGAGASTLDSLDFRVDDPRAALATARVAAMDDARARATTIARAAGAKLGDVLAVSEGEPYTPPIPFPAARMALKAQDASTPVEAGTQELSVAVTVTFAIK